MPHSSGGGSHGGGFHGGSRSGSRSTQARISHTPYPGARRYRCPVRGGGYRYFYTTREPGKIFRPVTLLNAFLMLPSLIISIWMLVLTYQIHFVPHDQEIIIKDEAHVLSDDAALMDALVRFRDKTHITPAVVTVYNEEWKNKYIKLEQYAYDRYLDEFRDEMHWLIVYSQPQDIPNPNNFDWYWEGMQGDATDLILTEKNTEIFGEFLQEQIKENPQKLSESLAASFLKIAGKGKAAGITSLFGGIFLLAITLFFGYYATGLDALKYRRAEPDPGQSA